MTRLVAEALPRMQRLRLVSRLHEHGLTDAQVAELTAYSTYTAARIRSSLGLAPNPEGRCLHGPQDEPPVAGSRGAEPPEQL